VSCPTPARLAAAVSGEDAATLAHAHDCVTCRGILVGQRDVVAAARMMRVPPLRAEHRAALMAEVIAQSDLEDMRPWRGERVMAIAASFVAAAAVITIVVAMRGPRGSVPEAPHVASVDEPAVETASVMPLEKVAAPLRAAVVSVDADFAREQHGDVDVVTLRDGVVSVDATHSEPVTIVAGDTRVTIASSRAEVVARHGVIVTTHVFAGTAEVSANGRSQVIDAGDVWMRDPERPQVPATQAKVGDSLAAFRIGWEQLREHHYPQAIAAFDRAIDPVVAEDAAFWAAIASERVGDNDGAATRLRAFLERFPTSPRAEAARVALERVTK
jgi:hypothetical protein